MPSKTKKVQKKRGRRVKSKKHHKTQKGGAYGNTMNSMTNNAKANLGFGYSGPVKYNHCGGSKGVAIFNNRFSNCICRTVNQTYRKSNISLQRH